MREKERREREFALSSRITPASFSLSPLSPLSPRAILLPPLHEEGSISDGGGGVSQDDADDRRSLLRRRRARDSLFKETG